MGHVVQKSDFTLIKSARRREVTSDTFRLPSQAELFAAYAPNVLIFVTFPTATDEEFLRALNISKPGLVIDVRRFPRFDIGSLTRQKAFEEFSKRQISYIDYAWHPSESVGADFACPYLGPELHRLKGRLMILLEERPQTSELLKAIAGQILSLTRSNWDIVQIPSYLPNTVASDLAFG
jgi:hypothetical protein